MNVTVVGTGYVGLVTGTCLAEVGNNVMCIDTDTVKVSNLKQGIIPIYEPGLEPLVIDNQEQGRLSFSTDIKEGIEFADVLFIAVGTPPDEDGSADLQYVVQVAESIGTYMNEYKLVITKSTVPVGTSHKVRNALQSQLDVRGLSLDFSVASNPEFLKEGAAVEDFMKPDRIVVGVSEDRALDLLRTLYAPFNRNHDRLISMDIPSAELTKYTANAMLATKISFMNEIANIAELLGADIEAVRRGIGSDPRIGYHFIYPGCGYGGSCFPKDVQALYRTANEYGYDSRILNAVESVNNDQKTLPVAKLKKHYPELSGLKIALWGLAFKPNTDDMRAAPSRVVIDELLAAGAQVAAFDPVAHEEAARIYDGVQGLALHSEDPYSVLVDADALIIVTEWKAFRAPDFEKIKQLMKGNVIVDGRNIFDPAQVIEAGFKYDGIGRG